MLAFLLVHASSKLYLTADHMETCYTQSNEASYSHTIATLES